MIIEQNSLIICDLHKIGLGVGVFAKSTVISYIRQQF